MIGRTIDRYQVIEQLGAGGMGIVYRARDTLLDRHVALKVLPPDQITDTNRRQRFIREAKAASALNHPGIVAIHDVLRVDDQDVIVMELVEGRTLDELLGRQRLGFGLALGYAIQIAEAVARAHAAGVVHRDLKPANVMVTGDGVVKILDFGLAKLVEPDLPDDASPTMPQDAAPLTARRVVIGTLAYMSPEQAAAEPVDSRSDIFAFGVIAYEMLTGKHPFRQGSSGETLQAIVDPHPNPPSEIVTTLSPDVDRAVLRCLHKTPKDRWQSLSDLKVVLQDIKEDSESGRKIVVGQTARPSRLGRWIFGAVAVIALTLLALVYFQSRGVPTGERPLSLSRLTYDGGLSGLPGISRDGNLVAYASDRGGGDGQLDIWVRHVNQPDAIRLTRHPADDWMPRFSPDGSRIVFHSWRDGGGIYLVSTLGGKPKRLVNNGAFPHYSPVGSQIVFVETPAWARGDLRRIFLVSPDEGAPRPFMPDFGTSASPQGIGAIWSPDGTQLMFVGAPFEDPRNIDWWVAPVEGGPPRSSGINEAVPRIDVVQFPVVWLEDQLLFVAGTTIEGLNLYSVSISREGKITGPHRPLTTGPGMTWAPTVADDGRIALSRLTWLVNLWQVELDPDSGRARGEANRVSMNPSPKYSFSLTRDGNRLAFSTYSGPAGRRRVEVRLHDFSTGQETVQISLPARTISLRPFFSRDGSMLSWADFVEGQRVAYVAPTDDPEDTREICVGCEVLGFLSDGSQALVRRGAARLELLSLDDGESTKLLELKEGVLLGADLSWDDRWVAVWTGRPDERVTIEIVPLRDGSLVVDSGIEFTDGRHWTGVPRWSVDGRFLYYTSDQDDFLCIWAQPLDVTTKRPVGEPFAVLHAHNAEMKMRVPRKSFFTLTVGHGRLVFNAGETSSEVYTAMLENVGN